MSAPDAAAWGDLGPGWMWLEVAGASLTEAGEIAARLGFSVDSSEDMASLPRLPSLEDHESYLLISLRGLVIDDNGIGTGDVVVFLRSDCLLTFHQAELGSIEWVMENLERIVARAEAGPDLLLAEIAAATLDRYLPLLDELDDRIERLEQRALLADITVMGEVQALRRDVIKLRRVAGTQGDVVRRLGEWPTDPVGPTCRRVLSGASDRYFRLVESLDTSLDMLSYIFETYRGAVAEHTNDVMRVLTVFAAILLPLSLVAGLYGMNFDWIPGSSVRWGFVFVVTVMLLVAFGMWLYFVRRGFIGGPRARDLPKAVGLGLAHAAATPVKATRRLGKAKSSSGD